MTIKKKTIKVESENSDILPDPYFKAKAPVPVTLLSRSHQVVSTGTKIHGQAIHEYLFKIHPNLAKHGVALSADFVDDEGCVTFALINSGREIVTIRSGDPIAKIVLVLGDSFEIVEI